MEQLTASAGHDEYRQAFGSIRLAKNIFWWLIFLAIGVQLAGFIAIRFGKVIDADIPAARAAAATRPATQPAGKAATTQPADKAPRLGMWYRALQWALPATKFMAFAAGMLLVLTLMFAVKIALQGRTGGVGPLMSAFFWSLLLWVFLVPWQQVLAGSTFACGALYNLGDVIGATGKVAWGAKADGSSQALYYARFIAYPAVVVILWVIVQMKFASGLRRATLGVARADVAGSPEELSKV